MKHTKLLEKKIQGKRKTPKHERWNRAVCLTSHIRLLFLYRSMCSGDTRRPVNGPISVPALIQVLEKMPRPSPGTTENSKEGVSRTRHRWLKRDQRTHRGLQVSLPGTELWAMITSLGKTRLDSFCTSGHKHSAQIFMSTCVTPASTIGIQKWKQKWQRCFELFKRILNCVGNARSAFFCRFMDEKVPERWIPDGSSRKCSREHVYNQETPGHYTGEQKERAGREKRE